VFCQKKIEALHHNWYVQDTIMSSRSNRISRSIFATSKMPVNQRRGAYQTVFSFDIGDEAWLDGKSEPGGSPARSAKD
jgi:hypothetical protein